MKDEIKQDVLKVNRCQHTDQKESCHFTLSCRPVSTSLQMFCMKTNTSGVVNMLRQLVEGEQMNFSQLNNCSTQTGRDE